MFYSAGVHQVSDLYQTEKHPSEVKAISVHSFTLTCVKFFVSGNAVGLYFDLHVTPGTQFSIHSVMRFTGVYEGGHSCGFFHKQPETTLTRSLSSHFLFPCSPEASAWTVWWKEWWSVTMTSTLPTSPRGSFPSSSPQNWRSSDTGSIWRRWLPCSSPNTRTNFWWGNRIICHKLSCTFSVVLCCSSGFTSLLRVVQFSYRCL